MPSFRHRLSDDDDDEDPRQVLSSGTFSTVCKGFFRQQPAFFKTFKERGAKGGRRESLVYLTIGSAGDDAPRFMAASSLLRSSETRGLVTLTLSEWRRDARDLFDFITERADAGREGSFVFSPAEARRIFVQLVSALDFWLGRGMLLVDVKHENVLVDPATLEIRLLDFDSTLFPADKHVTFDDILREDAVVNAVTTTRPYSPPEFLRKRRLAPWRPYLPYAAGVFLFALYHHDVPHEKDGVLRESRPPYRKDLSAEERGLLDGLLERNNRRRFSWKRLVRELPSLA